jgi:rhombotail lipoprotein
MKSRSRIFSWVACGLVGCVVLVATGCAHLYGQSQRRQNASVVSFLYPEGTDVVVQPAVPTLNLPIDVGVAFVPSVKLDRYFVPDISEERKTSLLRDVAREFEQYKFVRKIEVIPTAYLRPGGSFANLDQVARMFGVQVIALVSYDQVQFTDVDFTSFAYWTLVGAYVVEGEKNDTQTLLDAVVYDVASRQMLFRAPGVSRIQARSTPVNLSEELRDDADKGFRLAATNLAANLKTELASFQERVRNRPEEVKLVSRPGYVGGGAGGVFEIIILLTFGGATWVARKQRSM